MRKRWGCCNDPTGHFSPRAILFRLLLRFLLFLFTTTSPSGIPARPCSRGFPPRGSVVIHPPCPSASRYPISSRRVGAPEKVEFQRQQWMRHFKKKRQRHPERGRVASVHSFSFRSIPFERLNREKSKPNETNRKLKGKRSEKKEQNRNKQQTKQEWQKEKG